MKETCNYPIVFIITIILNWAFPMESTAQSFVYEKVNSNTSKYDSQDILKPFKIHTEKSGDDIDPEILNKKLLLDFDRNVIKDIIAAKEEFISVELPWFDGETGLLKLYKTSILSDGFRLTSSTMNGKEIENEMGVHYWGIFNDDPSSAVAFSVGQSGIIGSVFLETNQFILGAIDNSERYVLYETKDLNAQSGFNCFTDDVEHFVGDDTEYKTPSGEDNCVQLYIEVRDEIYSNKGTLAATSDYITGALSQVFLLYANESINMTIKELFIWDTNDPYSGSSTSNLLYQFRDRLNGNYNGDLAHLVGYTGGGGIAYVDALCFSFYGVGYSGISSYYYNVPTYNWTVEVMTHELGHNLGSPHTHACAWNGNNTAIDGCGYLAGYSEGCNGPIPSSGTIMSYCHLIGAVGIDFNLGFGPQPGNLIRDRVYNAPCLTVCTSCGDIGNPCDDGDPCTISDTVNSACNCEGTYTDADGDGFCVGEDPDDNDPCNPDDSDPSCSTDCDEINLENFESGWGIWNSGGNDATRLNNSTYAYSGTFSIRLRDNSGSVSSMYTEPLALSAYEDISIVFTYLPNSMENNEDFFLEISTNGGSSFSTVKEWNSGNQFQNGTRYFEQVAISGFNLSDQVVLRFRCDASGNGDQIYIDDVEVFACGTGTPCTQTGQSCEDGDVCTTGEVYDENCNCDGGVYTDADGDGFCIGEDPDDDDPCNPDDSDPSCSLDCNDFNSQNFESGWGIWNDGGSDVRRNINDDAYANSGDYCIRLRDNSGVQSSIFTNNLDLSSFDGLNVSFSFYARSMENNEDFFLEISTNGGSSYSIVQEWNSGSEFQNNQRYNVTVSISEILLTANVRLRIRCDASANNDYIYIDDVVIEGCLPAGSCPQQGQDCNDGEPCTIGETYDVNCDCGGGIYTDDDGDGYCIGEDPDDNDPCIPDSGASSCSSGASCDDINYEGFENGWGIWHDGGEDVRRNINDAIYANTGVFCVRLRDNSGAASAIHTSILALSSYDQLKVNFSFYARSMEQSEDFFLEISTDGGSNYSPAQEWNSGSEFQNNQHYDEQVIISGVTLSDQVRLRFRCDASANNDYIYIDDIQVSACNPSSFESNIYIQNEIDRQESKITIYPNPLIHGEWLNLVFSHELGITALDIFNIEGEKLRHEEIPSMETKTYRLENLNLSQGTYFIRLKGREESFIKRFVVIR